MFTEAEILGAFLIHEGKLYKRVHEKITGESVYGDRYEKILYQEKVKEVVISRPGNGGVCIDGVSMKMIYPPQYERLGEIKPEDLEKLSVTNPKDVENLKKIRTYIDKVFQETKEEYSKLLLEIQKAKGDYLKLENFHQEASKKAKFIAKYQVLFNIIEGKVEKLRMMYEELVK